MLARNLGMIRTFSQCLVMTLAATACGNNASQTTASAPVAEEAEPTALAADNQGQASEIEIVVPTTLEEMGEQTLSMLASLTAQATEHQGECSETIAAFRDTFMRYQESIAVGNTMQEEPENRLWFEENYSYKINQAALLMRESLGECVSDPGFQEVMKLLN